MATATLPKGPLWMQNVDYPASWDRILLDTVFPIEGVLAGFSVTPAGGLNIAIAAGQAVVQGDEVAGQGKYLVDSDASVNLLLAAVGVDRTEYVYLTINDPAVAGGRAGNNAKIETGASVPANSAILLATLVLPAGTATITAGMITDGRAPAGPRDAVGTITMFAGSRIPFGKLFCDGTAVSRTTYSDLFAQIGTAYGVGNGSTTFNLPDLRGRVPIGKAAAGTFATEGAVGGAETVTLTEAQIPSHAHTGPSHQHTGPNHRHTGPNHQHTIGAVSLTPASDHQHDTSHDHPLVGSSYGPAMEMIPMNVLVLGSGGASAIATTAGGQTVTLVDLYSNSDHSHTVDIPPLAAASGWGGNHNHAVSSPGATGFEGAGFTAYEGTGVTGLAGTGATGLIGGGGAHANLQPYQVVMGFLIQA